MRETPAAIYPSRAGLVVLTFVAIGALAAFFLFWKLGTKPLENWDEGIHAEVSREMYREGHWISLSYREAFYTAKPPLKFWLTAALFPLLGETEFAIRFWSAIAGLATTLLLGLWALQWSKSVRLALLAAVLFVSGRFILFHAFRTGETDGLLVFFIVAGLYSYWKSLTARRWFLVFGASVGLALMTKSFAGFIPLIVVGIDLTLARKWSAIGMRTVLWAAVVALAIALPWHLIEIVRRGGEFWSSYFGFHVLDRTNEVLYANVVPWYWYGEIIFKRMFPFSVFLPWAIFLSIRRALQQRDPIDRMLLIYTAVVFALFTIVKTKFDWYILPIYPGLVLLLSRSISEFLHERSDRITLWGALVSFGALVYALPFGLAHAGILWRATPYAYLPQAAVSLPGRLMVSAGICALLFLIVLLLAKRTVVHATRVVGIVLVVAICGLSLGWLGSYLRHLPTTSALKEVSEKVHGLKATSLDVIGVDLLRQPAGYFYLRRIPNLTLREVKSSHDLESALVLTTTDPAYLSVRSSGRGILQRDTYRLIDRSEIVSP